MTDITNEIKQMIIDELELEDMTVDDIDSNEMLFGEGPGGGGLGLDSIDALELGLALQKRFQVKIDANSEHNKEYFRSVASLCEFVLAHRTS